MLAPKIQEVLDAWRDEFASDRLIWMRDRSHRGRMHRLYVRRKIQELGNQLALQPLGLGSSRMVFALSATRVLKVAFSQHGFQANRQEAEASKKLPRELHAVVRAVAGDGLWLIQERVRPVTTPRVKGISKLRAQVEETIGVRFWDMRTANVGYRRDGSLVLIDLEDVATPVGGATIPRYLTDWWKEPRRYL